MPKITTTSLHTRYKNLPARRIEAQRGILHTAGDLMPDKKGVLCSEQLQDTMTIKGMYLSAGRTVTSISSMHRIYTGRRSTEGTM